MPSNIRFRGGQINNIEGDYRVVDRSRHETNINSHNMMRNKVTESFNTNFEKIGERFQLILIQGRLMTRLDDQRREDYAGLPPSQPHQNFPAGGRIDNLNSFNMKNTQINNVFNDNSETHCKYESMQYPGRF
jgi:hypothetical protein